MSSVLEQFLGQRLLTATDLFVTFCAVSIVLFALSKIIQALHGETVRYKFSDAIETIFKRQDEQIKELRARIRELEGSRSG